MQYIPLCCKSLKVRLVDWFKGKKYYLAEWDPRWNDLTMISFRFSFDFMHCDHPKQHKPFEKADFFQWGTEHTQELTVKRIVHIRDKVFKLARKDT